MQWRGRRKRTMVWIRSNAHRYSLLNTAADRESRDLRQKTHKLSEPIRLRAITWFVSASRLAYLYGSVWRLSGPFSYHRCPIRHLRAALPAVLLGYSATPTSRTVRSPFRGGREHASSASSGPTSTCSTTFRGARQDGARSVVQPEAIYPRTADQNAWRNRPEGPQ